MIRLKHGSTTLKDTRASILANRKVVEQSATPTIDEMTMSRCLKRSKNMKHTKKTLSDSIPRQMEVGNADNRKSDVSRDPNRPLTMSERLKQYEQGKVDV